MPKNFHLIIIDCIMLRTILSISGKPGLYKLVAQAKNMLIVETIAPEKKRIPAYGNEKITSLGDIAMYTIEGETPLAQVLIAIRDKENGAVIPFDLKTASSDQRRNYFAEVLPNFDRERVYTSDIKKLFAWYNILVTNGITEFEEKVEDPETEAKAEE